MPWVDDETGEASETCPNCYVLEREARLYRAKITRLENEADRQMVAKRDAAVWKELLNCWLAVFDKRPTATGIRSARATAVFQRLELGASVEDIKNAIAGATKMPYMHYGHRAAQGDSLEDDIQEIMHIGKDAEFDRLREIGEALRAKPC